MTRLLLASLLLMPYLAWAQEAQPTPCGPIDLIHEHLQKQYHERPLYAGQSNDNAVIVYANPETGTWTIVAMRSDGQACIKADGEHWRTLPDRKPDGESY